MMWDDSVPEPDQDSHLNYDLFSALSKSKDYYKILEVDYDATEDAIRSNFIRLALKWHPDKQKHEDAATSRFQEINEAYQVLSDPAKRREYDKNGMLYFYDYNLIARLSLPLQGAYTDMQWPWHKAFNMLNRTTGTDVLLVNLTIFKVLGTECHTQESGMKTCL